MMAELRLDRAIELRSISLISEWSKYHYLSFIKGIFFLNDTERKVWKEIFVKLGSIAWENVFQSLKSRWFITIHL